MAQGQTVFAASRHAFVPALLLTLALAAPSSAGAAMVTVNWNTDSTADGLATGTLLGQTVTFTSTDGPVDGGIVFASNWASLAGSNDVPGIGDPGVVNEAVSFDWNNTASGSVTITFGGDLQVVNPVLLFNRIDLQVETFDFADTATLNFLDQNPAGSFTLDPGNVISSVLNTHANSLDDGFAVQLIGTFSSITFNTNVDLQAAQSVGFTVLIDQNLAVIPEPSTLTLAGVCALLGGVAAWRGRRRRPLSA